MPINADSLITLKIHHSKQLNQWLNYQDPLTDKLKKIKGDTQLELISQKWVNAGWWSKNVLNIPDKQVFQREIMMRSHDIPYWYARSIIPQTCYDCDPIFFDRLKNESIKNLIFDDKRVTRINRIVYPIDQRCMEFHWVKQSLDWVDGVLWVRLAEFSFQNKALFYLVEVLLPEIEGIN